MSTIWRPTELNVTMLHYMPDMRHRRMCFLRAPYCERHFENVWRGTVVSTGNGKAPPIGLVYLQPNLTATR